MFEVSFVWVEPIYFAWTPFCNHLVVDLALNHLVIKTTRLARLIVVFTFLQLIELPLTHDGSR